MKKTEDVISRHRNAIMGLAAIMVLLAHSTAVVDYPDTITRIISFGNAANNIFAFVSGFGLFFALSELGGVFQIFSKKVCEAADSICSCFWCILPY